MSFALLFILFLLFEYFPGRKFFYSIGNLTRFIDKHLIKHLVRGAETRKQSLIRTCVVCVFWLLLVLAFANPRWDFEEVETAKPNVNLVILLDISKSMDAKDEKPSRLQRAKQEILDVINKSEAVNIGLIAFANQAHIVSPVTDDRNAIKYLLPSINTGLVGVQGSNIAAGLKSADLLLKPLEDGMNYILVMSDGGFEEKDLRSLAQSVKNGRIITFGFGENEGAPIPDENGKSMKDDNGKIVISKLEKEKLIALSGLDNYVQLSYLDDDTQKIVKIITQQMSTKKQKSHIFKIWHDRFYIPLAAAMVILLYFFRRGAIFPLVLIMVFAGNAYAVTEDMQVENPQVTAKAAAEEKAEEKAKGDQSDSDEKSGFEKFIDSFFKNDDEQAHDLFDDRQYKQAGEKFKSDYNKGVAAFRAGDYATAESEFAIEKDKNVDAEYNLGNAQLLQNKLPEAIVSYEDVLKKDPDNSDARHNLEIARKLLNQPKNKNNQDKSKSDQKDQNQKNQPQQSDNQSGQDKKDQKDNNTGQNQQSKSQDQASQQQNSQSQNNGNQQNKQQQSPQQANGDKEQKQDNGTNGEGQKNNDNSQNSNGNGREKELDIQAKSILSKVSSDPSPLMKNRFRYEEQMNGSSEENPKPW